MKEDNTKLLDYLEAAKSPFHIVSRMVKDLKDQGFSQIEMGKPWDLTEGGKYFINHHGTTLIAFVVPEHKEDMLTSWQEIPLRIAAAHTDYPCLRIKANPDVVGNGYLKINTEVYGGAILNTWLDRPLGVAGRVALKSKESLKPEVRYYDSKRALLTVPNLAIHQNREVNKGVELNKQVDLLPVFGMGEDKDAFVRYLAEDLKVEQEDILDFELTAYAFENPMYVGGKEEMISSPRIDNVSSCAAIVEALTSAKAANHIQMGVCFDHEEIGSHTKQGAGSAILTDVIEKLYEALGFTARDAKDAIYEGLMLSTDVAHATHPNHPEKEDIVNMPVMGKGFAIKAASSQSYATDCVAIAMAEQLAKENHIPYQKFVNRSDVVGGGTLGAISSALLPMKTVDIGVPMLAMHSARELMGEADYASLRDIVAALYK